LGDFQNRSPWGYIQGRLNLYDFCKFNPVVYVEPYSAVRNPGPITGPQPPGTYSGAAAAEEAAEITAAEEEGSWLGPVGIIAVSGGLVVAAGISEGSDIYKDYWYSQYNKPIPGLGAVQPKQPQAAPPQPRPRPKPDRPKCQHIYDSYQDAAKHFRDLSCRAAKNCDELRKAIDYLTKEINQRVNYIQAGCDKIDWGTSRTPQEKSESHWDQFRSKMRALENCWKKSDDLNCCFKMYE
jgi:hypothetical protein